MAGVLGRLQEFDAMLEPWDQYVERLGHFLDATLQISTREVSDLW